MARRRPHSEEHENHERWLVSYADFITLLFAFFVVMYAVSSVNEGKYRVLSDSLVSAFRNIPNNTSGPTVAAGTTAPLQLGSPNLPRPVVASRRTAHDEERKRQTRVRMRGMAQEIVQALGPLVKDGRVRISEGVKGVTVEINASVLFAPGDARIEGSAMTALRAVAQIIARTDFPVTVEGHTDNTPISTAQFPSNWELSVVRASTVVRLFVDAGVAPGQLMAAGYGEQRPVAGNDTAQGRQRNRRVTILIESPAPDAPSEPPTAPARLDTSSVAG